MVEKSELIDDVWAIVVHHKRLDTIGSVVRVLLDEGIPPGHLMVVDNSDDETVLAALQAGLPEGVVVVDVANRGYGAAVNDGLRKLRLRGTVPQYLLVATHEVRVERGSVRKLRAALVQDNNLSAVGPTLLSSEKDGSTFIWSAGGYSTRTGTLRHYAHRSSSAWTGHPIEHREWLDGAFVLYRASALPSKPFDESFFMYMEEVDLHRRLGYAGGKLGWVPEARVWQSSDGVPPRYFGRNTRLLARKHHSFVWRLWAVPVIVTRRALSLVVHRRPYELRQLIAGCLEPLPSREERLVIVNPLGAALAHYGTEVRQICSESNIAADEIGLMEPSASGRSRFGWLGSYLSAIWRAKRIAGSTPIVSVWPVIGHLDRVVLSLLAGRSYLIIHDPLPLVAAVGYGSLARRIGRSFGRTSIVVHSKQAARELQRGGEPEKAIVFLPHPISVGTESVRAAHLPGVISVMGQYKPDRDVELMEVLAARSSGKWDFRVFGRNWPKVSGWKVDSRFLSEDEFDRHLRESSVILIPYRRFYQSGVAIRALEAGTPVVGPRDSVLDVILGPDSVLTVGSQVEEWETAITSALALSEEEITHIQLSYASRVREGWREFVDEFFVPNRRH